MTWTYLQLVNRVLLRLNEVQLTSSTFTSAVGFQASVQSAVNDALNDIYDAERRWPFLWASTTKTTSPYVNSYAIPTTYTEVDWNSFFRQPNLTYINPDTGAAEPLEALKLQFISYQDWQDNYAATDQNIIASYTEGVTTGPQSQGGPPTMIFPWQDRLNFGVSTPPDDSIYTIYYEYYYKPTDLSAYSDTLVIPDKFSKVVIDGATYYSYMFRDNVEEAQAVQKKFTDGIAEMRRQLINKQDYMRSDQIIKNNIATPGYF